MRPRVRFRRSAPPHPLGERAVFPPRVHPCAANPRRAPPPSPRSTWQPTEPALWPLKSPLKETSPPQAGHDYYRNTLDDFARHADVRAQGTLAHQSLRTNLYADARGHAQSYHSTAEAPYVALGGGAQPYRGDSRKRRSASGAPGELAPLRRRSLEGDEDGPLAIPVARGAPWGDLGGAPGPSRPLDRRGSLDAMLGTMSMGPVGAGGGAAPAGAAYGRRGSDGAHGMALPRHLTMRPGPGALAAVEAEPGGGAMDEYDLILKLMSRVGDEPDGALPAAVAPLLARGSAFPGAEGAGGTLHHARRRANRSVELPRGRPGTHHAREPGQLRGRAGAGLVDMGVGRGRGPVRVGPSASDLFSRQASLSGARPRGAPAEPAEAAPDAAAEAEVEEALRAILTLPADEDEPVIHQQTSFSSKFRGVTKHRRTGRFEGHVWHDGKQLYLGGFACELYAARAHDVMVVKCRGQKDPKINFKSDVYADIESRLLFTSPERLIELLRGLCRSLAPPSAPDAGRPA